jgi:hypothetical protein
MTMLIGRSGTRIWLSLRLLTDRGLPPGDKIYVTGVIFPMLSCCCCAVWLVVQLQ